MCTTTQPGIPAPTPELRSACQGSCDAAAKSQCGSAAQPAPAATATAISLDALRAEIKQASGSKQ